MARRKSINEVLQQGNRLIQELNEPKTVNGEVVLGAGYTRIRKVNNAMTEFEFSVHDSKSYQRALNEGKDPNTRKYSTTKRAAEARMRRAMGKNGG